MNETTSQPGIISLAILAMGGEGGGVLADWLVDLGPEGGSKGGQIIAVGTPEQVAEMPQSHTGYFLKPLLARERS